MKKSTAYNTWQDLLDDEAATPAPVAAPVLASVVEAVAPAGSAVEIPPDLLVLMAEKERLKKKLDALTGQAVPDPADERFNKMFSVPVHTKESRIEERRQRREDERQRMLLQRALERQNVAKQAEKSQAEQNQRQKRDLQLRKRLVEEQAAREQEQIADQRRKVLEKSLISERFIARQKQAQHNLQRHRQGDGQDYARWEAQRQHLLQARAQERRAKEAPSPESSPVPAPKLPKEQIPDPQSIWDERRERLLERKQFERANEKTAPARQRAPVKPGSRPELKRSASVAAGQPAELRKQAQRQSIRTQTPQAEPRERLIQQKSNVQAEKPNPAQKKPGSKPKPHVGINAMRPKRLPEQNPRQLVKKPAVPAEHTRAQASERQNRRVVAILKRSQRPAESKSRQGAETRAAQVKRERTEVLKRHEPRTSLVGARRQQALAQKQKAAVETERRERLAEQALRLRPVAEAKPDDRRKQILAQKQKVMAEVERREHLAEEKRRQRAEEAVLQAERNRSETLERLKQERLRETQAQKRAEERALEERLERQRRKKEAERFS